MKNYAFLITLLFLSGHYSLCAFATETEKGARFFKNSEVDLVLKNVWMLNTTNQLSEQGVGSQNAWAQAAHLNFRSGWYNDIIGFDASWYGVAKLYANDAFYGRDLLRDNNGHAEGFNKLGQLYTKVRFGDEARYLRLYAGWRQLYKFGMLNITRSRAVPSSYEGISAETLWNDIGIRAAVVQRFSERDEPEKRHFETLKSKKRIHYITTGDISWRKNKNSRISYLIGESENYILRQGIEVDWIRPLNRDWDFITRGAYYYNRGLSDWEGARGFTHSAQHYYGLVGYRYKNTEAGIAWSKTHAKLDKGLGHFYWHFGKNSRGAFNSPADGEANDYINDGEQMISLYGQYKMTENLVVGIYGNYGFGMHYQGVVLTEWESGAYFSWDPMAIPGLNIFAGVGPGYTWKLKQNNPWLTENHHGYHHAVGIGSAVRVEYKLGLFN